MFSATVRCLNMHTSCLFLLFFISHCTAFTSQDYASALEKSILFFEGQRSGKLPPSQRLNWRGDSGLSDGSGYHVDLVGGYYDAGDNVKFGLPMAFTTTLLAWSVIEFSGSMKSHLEHAKDAVRWGSDYLLKASTAAPEALYIQVGDPNNDHSCWERPEDMDTNRNVYQVTPQHPGSDVAAETAAALAAASIVFKDSDPSYSSKLLKAAKKVFDFADRYRGAYSDSVGSVCPFYCSYSGYRDELLWGASWLNRASQDNTYLSYIQTNGRTLGSDEDDYSFSWDDKRAGTKILLSQAYLESSIQELEEYKVHSDNYICSLIPGTPGFQPQSYTPGGLYFKQSASNLQYVTTSTFLLLAYSKYLSSHGGVASCGTSTISPDRLVAQAKKQVDYILGNNPEKMSYMVGFGQRYPQHVHHRGSSLPSIHAHAARIGCNDGFQYFHSGSPNPNTLVGAIVGGPDNQDRFVDDRSNYQQSEPATYINAPFVGALAFFTDQSTQN